MRRSKEPRPKRARSKIVVYGIILASLALMGGIVYFVYTSLPGRYSYRLLFQLNIIIGNPDNNQTQFAAIPANIGVDPALWNFHDFDAFGVNGRAPIYTLEDTGIVRVQSGVRFNYTLGDFFNIWGRSFNQTCIQVDQFYCSNSHNHMFLSLLVRHTTEANYTVNPYFQDYVMGDRDSIRVVYQQFFP